MKKNGKNPPFIWKVKNAFGSQLANAHCICIYLSTDLFIYYLICNMNLGCNCQLLSVWREYLDLKSTDKPLYSRRIIGTYTDYICNFEVLQ